MKTEWKTYGEIAQETTDWMLYNAGVIWRVTFVALLGVTCPVWLPIYAVNKWYWGWAGRDETTGPFNGIALVGRFRNNKQEVGFRKIHYCEALQGCHFDQIIVVHEPRTEEEREWMMNLNMRLKRRGTIARLAWEVDEAP